MTPTTTPVPVGPFVITTEAPTPETDAKHHELVTWATSYPDDSIEQKIAKAVAHPGSMLQHARSLERQRNSALAEIARLREALETVKAKAFQISKIRWGYDGDGGSTALADAIFDTATEALTHPAK